MTEDNFTFTIDLTAGWAREAESRGLVLVSSGWNQDDGGWCVVVRDGGGQIHAGLIPMIPGGPAAIRYQFAVFCEGIVHEGDPAPPEMEFYGKNLLPPWMRD